MKHLSDGDRRYAIDLLAAAEIELSDKALSTMLRHVDWLLETTRTLNLTAIREPRTAVRVHLVDSLMALPEVRAAGPGLLLDIGTGGGFPGVELATAAERQALLVESVRKKAEALNAFLLHETLASWISVTASRAEEVARSLGQSAAVVTARALAPLPSLVELAAPLLVEGGRLVSLKGRASEAELTAGVEAARVCGLELVGVRSFVLPGGTDQRSVIVFQRVREPEIELPRRAGAAQKRPIA